MNIFFISDLHLFHENMLRGGKIAIRPFDNVHEMHQRIVDGWNSVVQPGHKVYMLGDLTLQRKIKAQDGHSALSAAKHYLADVWDIVRSLNGQKRLLLGNHDHLSIPEYHAMGFEKVMRYREMAGILFSHIPVHVSQFYRFRGNVHGHTHEAIVQREVVVQNAGGHYGEELYETRELRPDPRYINVCAEPRNYVPMSLDEIVAHYDKLEKW